MPCSLPCCINVAVCYMPRANRAPNHWKTSARHSQKHRLQLLAHKVHWAFNLVYINTAWPIYCHLMHVTLTELVTTKGHLQSPHRCLHSWQQCHLQQSPPKVNMRQLSSLCKYSPGLDHAPPPHTHTHISRASQRMSVCIRCLRHSN